jgi:hypothetical protein
MAIIVPLRRSKIIVQTSRRYKILALIIFFLSVALRLGMVSFNRESNDDHMQVISLIIKSGILPDKSNCWECYQPKLFHYTAAKFLQITGADKLSQNNMILAVELINFLAGLITVAVVEALLRRTPIKSETLKLLGFGLIALNPGLIGINSQATNDTFVILFSTLALYCTELFLQKRKAGTFLLMLLFSLLCISSKSNGVVTPIAITMALFIKAWMERTHVARLWLAGFLFIAATLVISIINPLNQYIHNTQKFGSPFLINVSRKPMPSFHWLSPKVCGIRSILDGYGTFKFGSLIQHPRLEYSGTRPDNCTSLWAVLYGEANSSYYTNFPPTWSTTGNQGFSLTRAIFILALLPALLILFGMVLEMGVFLKSIFKRDSDLAAATNYGLPLAASIGFILFLCVYLLLYTNLAMMKIIFIYPALILAFPLFFMRAGEFIDAHLKNSFRWVRTVFAVWVVTLLILYAADIISMIQLLYSRRMGI